MKTIYIKQIQSHRVCGKQTGAIQKQQLSGRDFTNTHGETLAVCYANALYVTNNVMCSIKIIAVANCQNNEQANC